METSEVFKKIDELSGKYIKVWDDVCNIESPTNFKEGVDRVGEYFLKLASEHNWLTDIFEQKISGNAVTITINPDSKEKKICLSGHMDTVHPVGSFGSPAVTMDEEKIYGPGVMDCKGGIVASFLAMDALKKCGFNSKCVKLFLQSDEENGSASSNKETINYICLNSLGAKAFLNAEGIKDKTAVLERKGIIRFKFTVYGKALHSSRCPEAANAICEAAYKIIELEKMKNPDGLTCNCGVINGGTTSNTVAEKCEFYADIRFATDKEMLTARRICKEAAEKTTVKGCRCEVEEISFRPAMKKSEKNYELLDKMNEIFKESGLPVLKARKCLSGSDAAYVTEAGIPCIDNIGVDGENIHSVNECARLSSLGEAAKRIAAVILKI